MAKGLLRSAASASCGCASSASCGCASRGSTSSTSPHPSAGCQLGVHIYHLDLVLCRSLDRWFCKLRQLRQQLLDGLLSRHQSENISDQMGMVANSKLLWTGESFVYSSVLNDWKPKNKTENEFTLQKYRFCTKSKVNPTMINQFHPRTLMTISQETQDQIESSAMAQI